MSFAHTDTRIFAPLEFFGAVKINGERGLVQRKYFYRNSFTPSLYGPGDIGGVCHNAAIKTLHSAASILAFTFWKVGMCAGNSKNRLLSVCRYSYTPARVAFQCIACVGLTLFLILSWYVKQRPCTPLGMKT